MGGTGSLTQRAGTHVGGIIAGWAEAWRSRRDNPLPAYWSSTERRQRLLMPWWKRGLSAMLIALLLGLLYLGMLYLLYGHLLSLRASPVLTRGYIFGLFGFAGTVLLGIAAVLVLVWLAACLFSVQSDALGFLERQPHRRAGIAVDDLLAVAALSEQALVMGFMLHVWRRLWLPLAAASLLLGAAMVLDRSQLLPQLFILLFKHDFTVNALNIPVVAGFAAIATVQLWLGGMAAASILCLALIPLGLCERCGLLPQIGPLVHWLSQLALFALLATYVDASFDNTVADIPLVVLGLGFGVPALLLLGLLMYVARRANSLRAVLGYAFPLVLAAMLLELYSWGMLGSEHTVTDALLAGVVYSWQVFEVFNPCALTGWLIYAIDDPRPLHELITMQLLNGAVVLVLQLAVIVVCAEFARDALRRRKWEVG